MLIIDSTDIQISSACMKVGIERKNRERKAVDRADAQLRNNILVGSLADSHDGLGSHSSPPYDKAQGKEKHWLIQEDICAEVQEDRLA